VDTQPPQPTDLRQAEAPELLKLLADDTRWRMVALLRRSDRQVGELVGQLGLPQNLVSYHLAALRQGGLVRVHRSDADGRASYYGLDLAALNALYLAAGALLALPAAPSASLAHRTVVFLCTGNSARSQMAEAWLRHLSGGRLTARSAGTEPRPIHPLTVRAMAEVGLDIGYQSSKSLDALAGLRPDLLVTVCDIAREDCAFWGAEVPQIHWSVADPARATGSEPARLAVFRAARDELRQRVGGLLAILPEPTGA